MRSPVLYFCKNNIVFRRSCQKKENRLRQAWSGTFLFLKLFSQKLVAGGRQRNSQQDARHAEQAASDHDCRKYEDAGKPNGSTDHAGLDQLIFQLLKHNDKQKEDQRLDG